ncbi:MAG: Glu/Leu/Phe/Val dehydrogenase dimerization domain-containing protein [Planctomycetota bacterium]
MSLRVARVETRADARGRRFELLRVVDDRRGLRAYLAIEEDARGRTAFGGIRRRPYTDEESARREAVALASGMALKLRFAELDAVGAKTVVLDHPEASRADVYEALADFVGGLEGRYVCGPDVGTGEDDLDRMRSRTRHVNDVANRPGLATARGVAAALEAALAFADAARPGRLHVQGLGSVGGSLARILADGGHRISGEDPDAEAREALAAALGDAWCGESDVGARVFLPCALGGTIDAARRERWRGSVICGSANDQLAPGIGPDDLAAAEILWVPDFAANAGAVIEGVLAARGRQAGLPAALAAIGPRVSDVLEEARRRGMTPWAVAASRAEDRP